MFNGPEYRHKEDYARLSKQSDRIKFLMLDGKWRTLQEIERLTGDPHASVSAQLRHLRKPRFGSFIVDRRSRGNRKKGLYEYRVLPPTLQHIRKQKRHRSKVELLASIKKWKKRAIKYRNLYNNLRN